MIKMEIQDMGIIIKLLSLNQVTIWNYMYSIRDLEITIIYNFVLTVQQFPLSKNTCLILAMFKCIKTPYRQN